VEPSQPSVTTRPGDTLRRRLRALVLATTQDLHL
jgi:hypothetical protein